MRCLTATEKCCPSCKTTKPSSCFGTRKGRTGRIYLASWCRDCSAAKGRAYQQAHRRRSPTAAFNSWKYSIKKNYGLSVEQYNAMLAAQAGVCAICHQAPSADKRLAVDHDHSTGQVRGLLCDMCNHGLGRLRDDVGLLRRAIEYLELAR